MPLANCHAYPAARLITRQHCLQESAAAKVEIFRDRPCGGDDDATRMDDRVTMEIIHLKDLRESAEVTRTPRRVPCVGIVHDSQHLSGFGLQSAKGAGDG